MKLNLPIEYKNTIQIVILFIIGIMCDAFVIAILSTLYIPETGWVEPHYTKFELLYRNFFNQYLYDYRSLISFIMGSICLLLIKLFLFPKIVISIENSREKTKVSEIIKNIHNNKNILLLCFIVFCLLSFLFVNFCTDIYKLNMKLTYFFVIPLHYLMLYFVWLYNDKKNNIKIDNFLQSNTINLFIELIKYVLITNPFSIVLSWLSLFNVMLNMFPMLEYIIVFIFMLLIIILALFYLLIVIKLLIKSLCFIVKNIIKNYIK